MDQTVLFAVLHAFKELLNLSIKMLTFKQLYKEKDSVQLVKMLVVLFLKIV